MLLCRHAILFVSVLMLWGSGVTSTRAESSVEPAGRVVSFPAKAFATGMSAEGEDTQVNILVPNKMDDEGTLTLTYSTRTQSASRLEISRDYLPEDLRFLCGDNESITVLASRPGGYTAYFPGQVGNTLSIPYNRNQPTPPGRTFLFIDCQEAPLTRERFDVRLSQNGVGLHTNIRLRGDGTMQLPAVIMPTPVRPVPGYPAQSSVSFTVNDKETGVAYSAQVNQDGKTSTTRLIFPLTVDEPTSPTVFASASVKASDGSALGGVSVTLPYVRQTFFYGTLGQAQLDDSDVPVRSLTANAQGNFTVALSPLMKTLNSDYTNIAVSVTQPDVRVYPRYDFPLSPGAHRDIVMPHRITVPFVCLDEAGKPISFFVKGEHVSYQFSLFRVNDNGDTQDTEIISIQQNETSGTEFLLNGLPAPGRYMLMQNDTYYGPAEVTENTEKLEFSIKPNNGVVKGRVLDETGKPLAGALVLRTSMLYQTRNSITDPGAVLEHLEDLDETAALAYLNTQTSGVLDYRVTAEDGTYQFPRTKRESNGNIPGYLALAKDRIGAYHHYVSDNNVPPYRDIPITDIHLPTTTTITGIVHAPEEMPDRAHTGKKVPMPPDQKYTVGLRESRGWFDQNTSGQVRWQYITSSEQFEFGKPFRYDVPVGTTVSVYASPRNDDVKLSLEIWKLDPLTAGETRETTPSTLRALQPYTLHLQYKDGSPGSGIEVNTLYGDLQHVQGQEYRTPQTDANGDLPLWGDEGLAPSMTLQKPYRPPTGPVYRQTRQPYQWVKIQKLDMSTSVPKLTLTLDPEKWGSSPEVEE